MIWGVDFLKGDKMNQEEWIAYFEEIYGRKPEPEELKQAILSREIHHIDGKVHKLKSFSMLAFFLVLVVGGTYYGFFKIQPSSTSSLSIMSSSLSESSSNPDEGIFIVPTSSSSIQEAQLKNMNLNALVLGDFSSIAGTWKNSYRQFEIGESGTFSWSDTSERTAINDVKLDSTGQAIGVWNTNYKRSGGTTPNTSDYIQFIPAGVVMQGQSNDVSRDRIVVGAYVERANDPNIFYRVSD